MTVAIKGRQGTLAPWRERNGRLSWLRLCVFLLLLAPGLWIAANLAGGTLGAKPVTEAIHLTGTWAIRFLVLSLLGHPAAQGDRLEPRHRPAPHDRTCGGGLCGGPFLLLRR